MNKIKLLAILTAIAMVFTLAPAAALGAAQATHPDGCDHFTDICQIDKFGDAIYYDAEGDTYSVNEDNFVVSTSKTIAATETENEFEITLKVETTEKVDENVLSPDVAVVLVMDISSSMKWTPEGNTANNQPDGDGTLWGNDNITESQNYEFYKDGTSRMAQAKVAARAFLDEYVSGSDDAARLISIVSFGSSAVVVQDWIDLSISGNMETAQEAIDNLIVTGDIKGQNGTQWTFLQGGLMIANDLINDYDISQLDNRFVITITDGNPTYYSDATTVSGNSITGKAFEPNGQPESANNVSHSREGAAPVAEAIKDSGVELYTIGFAIPKTTFAVSTSDSAQKTAEEWLSGYIASPGCALTAGTGLDLIDKLGEINEIIRSWTDAWIVSDPMGANIVWDSSNDISDNKTFVNNILRWNLRTSDPGDEYVRDADGKTVYVYEYSYNVMLDTFDSSFTEGDIYVTNEPTTVSYRTVERIDNNRPKFGEWAIANFTIPKVHGYAADFEFVKTIGNNTGAPLSGAEFNLFIDNVYLKTAISDNDGFIAFNGIPSGHIYTLVETAAPEGYILDDNNYTVTVSYGEINIVSNEASGFYDIDGVANLYFKNEPDTPEPPPLVLGPSYGTVTATNADNREAIMAGLNPKNGNPYYGDKKEPDTPYVVPNSNHFVFAQINRDSLVDGIDLEFMVGNKYEIVGTGSAQLVDDNIVITIDNLAGGEFGAIAFDKLPVFNNGNIHSQKVADLAKFGAVTGFNHDNVLTIPCPEGNTIYLYIHCGTLQFYI